MTPELAAFQSMEPQSFEKYFIKHPQSNVGAIRMNPDGDAIVQAVFHL